MNFKQFGLAGGSAAGVSVQQTESERERERERERETHPLAAATYKQI